MARKAKILLVEAASSSLSDLLTAVNYARSVSGVVAVSMSWGGSDFSGEGNYDSYFTTPSGHTGVTFLASSGDSGRRLDSGYFVQRRIGGRHHFECQQFREITQAKPVGATAAAASAHRSNRPTKKALSPKARPTAPIPTYLTTPIPIRALRFTIHTKLRRLGANGEARATPPRNGRLDRHRRSRTHARRRRRRWTATQTLPLLYLLAQQRFSRRYRRHKHRVSALFGRDRV